jgi:hypothetical protein
MSAVIETEAAISAETLPRAENLIESAPEIAPSHATFERIQKLMHGRGRGPLRTKCDDRTWDTLRAALKHMVPYVASKAGGTPESTGAQDYVDALDFTLGALLSLRETRPVQQLARDFCDATGLDFEGEVWPELERKTPTSDLGFLLSAAFCQKWPAMSDPPSIPLGRFCPRLPDLDAPAPKWLVKGVLPEKSLAVLYGRWGTGKSTIAVELGVAVARGVEWHGKKVKQGSVIYIASENAHGFRARLNALLTEQGLSFDALGERFLEITSRPHLLKPEQVTELIKELKPFGPSLVVIDTLARAVAGADENAAKEMGIAVENAQTIINELGATVMLVHHTGKDESKGMRGSSSLPAACDTEIVLERPNEDENTRVARIGKQRDGQDYCDLFSYELKVVELGRDEDDDPFTSVVVSELKATEAAASKLERVKPPTSEAGRAVWDAMIEATRPLSTDDLITEAAKRIAYDSRDVKKDQRRTRVRRAISQLQADGVITFGDAGVCFKQPALAFGQIIPPANDDLVGTVAGGAS